MARLDIARGCVAQAHVRIICAGKSNPEIAQGLFVTRKTVEFHLSSAYRKLEIHSREELAAALEGEPKN